MRLVPIVFALLFPICLAAQPDEYRFSDYTYQEYIKSVKFHVQGLALSYPIIDLEAGTRLKLSFDDLEYDVQDYFYKIVHCDKDWTRSSLSELEYVNGFSEARINDIEYSFNTLTPYTHYDLVLPNQDTRFTKSGNYLLLVYDEEVDEPLITRRFMVVDPQVKIAGKINNSVDVSKIRTHQEIDFRVNYEGLKLRNPQKEVRAVVLQNGRWDNAVTDIAPFFVRQDELIFDYQGKIIFPGGNEYRFLDLRDLRTNSNAIAGVERYEEGYDVTLFQDRKRSNEPYLFQKDLNGQFVIDHRRNSKPDTRNDYADVFFNLYSPTPLEEEVYLYGGLTEWQFKEELKMIYNDAISSYVLKTPLKEGYYDYGYALRKNGSKIAETQEMEGSWFNTSNEYIILVYYRPFGSRYDMLVGAYVLAFQ